MSTKCDVTLHDPVEVFVTVFGLQGLRMKMTPTIMSINWTLEN